MGQWFENAHLLIFGALLVAMVVAALSLGALTGRMDPQTTPSQSPGPATAVPSATATNDQ